MKWVGYFTKEQAFSYIPPKGYKKKILPATKLGVAIRNRVEVIVVPIKKELLSLDSIQLKGTIKFANELL